MKENEGQSFTELIVVYVITEEWGNQTRQPQRLIPVYRKDSVTDVSDQTISPFFKGQAA